MTFRARSGLVAIFLCCAPTAAFAQTVTDIELDETRQQKAGSTSDMYRFTGLTGTTVTAKLATTGDAALVFYTPDGEEMLSVKGSGAQTLQIILPFPDVYFVSVLREEAANPYSLQLEGVAPDDHFANFSATVGYERDETYNGKVVQTSQCWIEPGLRLRETKKGSKVMREFTLGRAGMEYILWKHPDGRTVSEQRRYTYAGSEVTLTQMDGTQPPVTMERTIATRSEHGNFTGYLCE